MREILTKTTFIIDTILLIVVVLVMFFPITSKLLGYNGFYFGIEDFRYLDLKWTFFSKLPLFLLLSLNKFTLYLKIKTKS